MCGFFHFARYMLESVFIDDEELSYIPMLCSNQSSLEGRFSSHRRRGLDRGDTYGVGVSITVNRQVISAISSESASYDHADVIVEDVSLKNVDWKVFEKHFEEADAAIEALLQRRKNKAFEDDASPSRFGIGEEGAKELIRHDSMMELFSKMNSLPLECGSFIDMIMRSQSFLDCVKLTHDEDEMS